MIRKRGTETTLKAVLIHLLILLGGIIMFGKRVLTFTMAAVMSVSAMTAMSAGASAEWVKFKDGAYGYRSDTTKKQLTGWQTISGSKYYFDKNGKALTGWVKINGDKYYFNGSDKGKMLTSWATIGKKKYYFGSDGIMRTGWIKLNGKTYYFGSDGAMRTGKIKIGNTVYDFGTNGILKSTENSSSLSAPMNGLKWGMSKNEVVKVKGDGKYMWVDPVLMYTGTDPMIVYYFDDSEGLVGYGNAEEYSSAAIKKYREGFKNDGWKYINFSEDPNSGMVIYLYAKDNAIGAVEYDSDQTMAMTLIFSGDYSESIVGGDISDYLE